MGIPDLFKTAASYLDFVVDFLSFRGLYTYALKNATSDVLVSYFICGFAMARFLDLINPIRKAVDDLPVLVRDYDFDDSDLWHFRGQDGKLKNVNMASEPAFSPMVRSLIGNFGLHLFLLLSTGILGVQPLGLKVTLNATLAFNAVYLPIASFVEPFSTLGRKLMKNTTSSRPELLGSLCLAATSFLFGLGAECYRFWSMSQLHGLSPRRLAIPVACYWGISLLVLLCYLITKALMTARRRRRFSEEFANL